MSLLRVALLISADYSPFTDYNSFSQFVKELEKMEIQVTPCYLDSPVNQGKGEDCRNTDLYSISRLFEHADEYDVIHSFCNCLPLAFSKLVSTPLVVTLNHMAVKKDMQLYRKYNSSSYYISDAVTGQSEELIYFDSVYTCAALENSRKYPSPGGYCLLFCSSLFEIEKALEITSAAGTVLFAVLPENSSLDSNSAVCKMVDDKQLSLLKKDSTSGLEDLLGNASAVLYFSEGKKSIDSSLVQAQSLGTPVIAFKDQMMEEYIIEGVNGFMAGTPEKAAEIITSLKDFDRQICVESYEMRFSPRAMASGYRRVYDRVYQIEKQDSKRPWGFFSVLYYRPPGCKVKEFVVLPGKRLSLQKHLHRAEYWQIVQGKGLITLDDRIIELSAGSNIIIPQNSVHRVENNGNENLVIIEVQQGDYVGEDDIIRLQDDFGREGDHSKN